jgi:hypothetical protein
VRTGRGRPSVEPVSTPHRHRTPSALLLAAATALVLAACTGGTDDTATTAPPPSPASSGSASAPGSGTGTGTGTGTAAGCAATGDGVPADAASVAGVDLDGDGEPDTLWLTTVGSAEGRAVGVTTASGATFSLPVDLAGPAGASALALGPDAGVPGAVIVTDDRLADLLVVQDCALVAVTDTGGTPWQFDLGYTGYGTGVGCVDVAGTGSTVLAGLNLTGDTGAAQVVTRTAIDVTGTVATPSGSDAVTVQPDDTAALESAREITCGDRTLTDDGVHEPQE